MNRRDSSPPKPAKPFKASLFFRRILAHPAGKVVFVASAVLLTTALFVFLYFYNHYANLVDDKLVRGPYSNTSKLYGAPQVVSLNDGISPDDIVESLQRAGYTARRDNRMGWYQRRDDGIEVFPGPDSYFQQEAHVVHFKNDRVSQIISLRDNTDRTQFWLEPELITALFDRNREKRRIVRFADIPSVMKNAVLAAEDKRFFQHAGFDPFRILAAAWLDIKLGRNKAGASTLSMQLARELLLTKERTWNRKIPEILITMHLERKLTKEEIFEHYANQISLGHVGSFNIHGFGEGAQAYFGKDLRTLNVPEAATLAGLVQGPSLYNPFRHPERARNRRNIILQLMRDNEFITPKEFDDATKAPLGITANSPESDDAPYFVDLIHDDLQNQFSNHDFQASSYSVYTTLDVNLQKAAAEAMKVGLKEVDEIMTKRGRTAAKGWPKVQAALVAIDPQNGEVKALSGGRSYGESQLNRALAKRQPGSAFKPFVYAAALSTAIDGGPNTITPVSQVSDEPTTFWFDQKPYEPNNFKGQFYGPVTLRTALAKSLNIPTVKFAEMAGYDNVASLARKAGLNYLQPTPAIALGAYEVKPIEIAGAYTIFANRGVFTQPNYIKLIRSSDGHMIYNHKAVRRQALDPRIAYMMVNLLEEVTRSGTAAGIRSRGFTFPAAGKTGTSHDGWFAGFTTELICVVWVGYDDNRQLGLEGAKSALPIWTEFMKRAHKFRPYRRAGHFSGADGIVSVDIDPATGKLASAGCGPSRAEVFLAGTQPLESCSGAVTQVASWDTASEEPIADSDDRPRRVASRRVTSIPVNPQPAQPAQPPKRGFFDRVIGIFRKN